MFKVKENQKQEEKFLKSDEILEMTAGGFYIYMHYLGDVRRVMKKPWDEDEKSPSFGIFLNDDGLYIWTDFSDNKRSGNAINMVQRKFGLTFGQACLKICKDLMLLNVGELPDENRYEELSQEREKRFRTYHIAFSTCPFDREHAAYWNQYHLSEDFLRSFDVYRVKDWALNHMMMPKYENELTFAYYHELTQKVKILRINVPKEDKWRNSVAGDVLWFKERITDTQPVDIAKSVKDALCLRLLGLESVATQSESSTIIERNAEWVMSLKSDTYLSFGSDEQGVYESMKTLDKFHHLKDLSTPKSLLSFGINDWAEWIKTDIKAVEKYLKQKNVV